MPTKRVRDETDDKERSNKKARLDTPPSINTATTSVTHKIVEATAVHSTPAAIAIPVLTVEATLIDVYDEKPAAATEYMPGPRRVHHKQEGAKQDAVAITSTQTKQTIPHVDPNLAIRDDLNLLRGLDPLKKYALIDYLQRDFYSASTNDTLTQAQLISFLQENIDGQTLFMRILNNPDHQDAARHLLNRLPLPEQAKILYTAEFIYAQVKSKLNALSQDNQKELLKKNQKDFKHAFKNNMMPEMLSILKNWDSGSHDSILKGIAQRNETAQLLQVIKDNPIARRDFYSMQGAEELIPKTQSTFIQESTPNQVIKDALTNKDAWQKPIETNWTTACFEMLDELNTNDKKYILSLPAADKQTVAEHWNACFKQPEHWAVLMDRLSNPDTRQSTFDTLIAIWSCLKAEQRADAITTLFHRDNSTDTQRANTIKASPEFWSLIDTLLDDKDASAEVLEPLMAFIQTQDSHMIPSGIQEKITKYQTDQDIYTILNEIRSVLSHSSGDMTSFALSKRLKHLIAPPNTPSIEQLANLFMDSLSANDPWTSLFSFQKPDFNKHLLSLLIKLGKENQARFLDKFPHLLCQLAETPDQASNCQTLIELIKDQPERLERMLGTIDIKGRNALMLSLLNANETLTTTIIPLLDRLSEHCKIVILTQSIAHGSPGNILSLAIKMAPKHVPALLEIIKTLPADAQAKATALAGSDSHSNILKLPAASRLDCHLLELTDYLNVLKTRKAQSINNPSELTRHALDYQNAQNFFRICNMNNLDPVAWNQAIQTARKAFPHDKTMLALIQNLEDSRRGVSNLQQLTAFRDWIASAPESIQSMARLTKWCIKPESTELTMQQQAQNLCAVDHKIDSVNVLEFALIHCKEAIIPLMNVVQTLDVADRDKLLHPLTTAQQQDITRIMDKERYKTLLETLKPAPEPSAPPNDLTQAEIDALEAIPAANRTLPVDQKNLDALKNLVGLLGDASTSELLNMDKKAQVKWIMELTQKLHPSTAKYTKAIVPALFKLIETLDENDRMSILKSNGTDGDTEVNRCARLARRANAVAAWFDLVNRLTEQNKQQILGSCKIQVGR